MDLAILPTENDDILQRALNRLWKKNTKQLQIFNHNSRCMSKIKISRADLLTRHEEDDVCYKRIPAEGTMVLIDSTRLPIGHIVVFIDTSAALIARCSDNGPIPTAYYNSLSKTWLTRPNKYVEFVD